MATLTKKCLVMPLMLSGAIAFAQTTGTATISEDGVIAGTMDITFKTRTDLDAEGNPNAGAKDEYSFNLDVAKTTNFSGKITRQPALKTKYLKQTTQEAGLAFDIDLGVRNPNDLKQKRKVGKWVGFSPINPESGVYALSGGNAVQRPLRIAVDSIGSVSGFTDTFDGRMIGKATNKDSLSQEIFKRFVGGREVKIEVKKSDPMKFNNLVLAKGPATSYPRTTVNGQLVYDYETGNWYTNGIRFSYNLNGQEVVDVVTGSIKWEEDDERAANGKGSYVFNLRFNEDKHKAPQTEAAMFDQMSEEDAFFAVDTSLPTLTGNIDYVDTFIAGGGDEPTPSASKVTYQLNAAKLTKVQVMNFFKLWMIGVGPTNDE